MLKHWIDINSLNWKRLSSNLNALSILEQKLNEIDWSLLSANPNAINLLEKNLDKIDWSLLSANPNAIYLLEANLDKINWNHLSVLNRICETNSIMNDCGHRIYFAKQNIYVSHLVIQMQYQF